jgi:hypothetical protein
LRHLFNDFRRRQIEYVFDWAPMDVGTGGTFTSDIDLVACSTIRDIKSEFTILAGDRNSSFTVGQSSIVDIWQFTLLAIVVCHCAKAKHRAGQPIIMFVEDASS